MRLFRFAYAVAYARDRGSLCQDFVSSGIAKEHLRANVGLLSRGGAHRKLRQTGRALLLR